MPEEEAPPGDPRGGLKDSPDRSMSFLDHLEDLRWTLLKAVLVFMTAFILVAVFLPDTASILNWPLNYAIRDNPDQLRLVTTTPLGIFSVFMMICFLGSVTISLPFILYFIGQFVAPALTKKESKVLLPVCAATVVLFLLGSAFSYFVLVPAMIKVSVYFNDMLGYELIWMADKYYSMVVWTVIGMGGAFQFPMVIQILIYLELVTVKKLRSIRAIMFLVVLVVSAVITPTPDPVTLFIVALPLYLLYELAIWVGAVITVPRAAEARAALDRD